MKTYFILLFTFSMVAEAQNTIYFSYDAAGNRIKRSITLPTVGQGRRKEFIEKDSVPFVEQLAKYKITVYPNPTFGALIINLDNHHPDSLWQYDVVNMAGNTLFKATKKEKEARIDLSQEPVGAYLLRTVILGETNTYKIIKE